jgi:hypothetical protein
MKKNETNQDEAQNIKKEKTPKEINDEIKRKAKQERLQKMLKMNIIRRKEF